MQHIAEAGDIIVFVVSNITELEVNKSFGKYCQYLSKFLRMLIRWGAVTHRRSYILNKALTKAPKAKRQTLSLFPWGPLFCWKAPEEELDSF